MKSESGIDANVAIFVRLLLERDEDGVKGYEFPVRYTVKAACCSFIFAICEECFKKGVWSWIPESHKRCL